MRNNDEIHIHELIENAAGFDEMDIVVRKAMSNVEVLYESYAGSKSPGTSPLQGSKVRKDKIIKDTSIITITYT